MSSYSRYKFINVEKKLESVCYYTIPKKRKKKSSIDRNTIYTKTKPSINDSTWIRSTTWNIPAHSFINHNTSRTIVTIPTYQNRRISNVSIKQKGKKEKNEKNSWPIPRNSRIFRLTSRRVMLDALICSSFQRIVTNIYFQKTKGKGERIFEQFVKLCAFFAQLATSVQRDKIERRRWVTRPRESDRPIEP